MPLRLGQLSRPGAGQPLLAQAARPRRGLARSLRLSLTLSLSSPELTRRNLIVEREPARTMPPPPVLADNLFARSLLITILVRRQPLGRFVQAGNGSDAATRAVPEELIDYCIAYLPSQASTLSRRSRARCECGASPAVGHGRVEPRPVFSTVVYCKV